MSFANLPSYQVNHQGFSQSNPFRGQRCYIIRGLTFTHQHRAQVDITTNGNHSQPTVNAKTKRRNIVIIQSVTNLFGQRAVLMLL